MSNMSTNKDQPSSPSVHYQKMTPSVRSRMRFEFGPLPYIVIELFRKKKEMKFETGTKNYHVCLKALCHLSNTFALFKMF